MGPAPTPEHQQFPGTPNVSIHQDTDTPHQHPLDTQHILQETQQQRLSQPGHQALDFTALLSVNEDSNAGLLNAEQAKQQLQQHISWFQATYGGSAPSMANTTTPSTTTNVAPSTMAQYPMTPLQQAMDLPTQGYQYQQPEAAGQAYPHTVPNTPQHRALGMRTPPPTGSKHNRSQSFQYDTAPLSSAFGDVFNAGNSGPLRIQQIMDLPNQLEFTDFTSYGAFDGDHSYASSAYSSSAADPMSPSGQFGSAHMPTVPEEALLPGDNMFLGDPNSLLDAAASASDDVGSPDQLHAPQPYSPRQAALLSLGNINASIEETGISAEEVNQYMSGQDPGDSKWTCMFPECGKKFGRRENIRAHIQTHLGDRQYRCNDCNKCFVRQHDLKRHAKIHSGDKPNRCPCGIKFARQDALTRHRQRGTCRGALPGFERREGERKKPGRPRKQRPDLETRAEKASRAREMEADATAGAARTGAPAAELRLRLAASQRTSDSGRTSVATDSAGPSYHSTPTMMTPAPSSEYDELLFSDFVEEARVDVAPFGLPAVGSWRDNTPPTSPASYQTMPGTVAPAALSNHNSSEVSSPESWDEVIEHALLTWQGDEVQV